jgi:succinyl-CoA synthetase beta subunit
VNLPEHEVKSLFSVFGIPVPSGKLATTPDEVYAITREIAGSVFLKPQTSKPNGRNSNSPTEIADTPEQAEEKSRELLNLALEGGAIQGILVEAAHTVVAQIYLRVICDRQAGKPLIIAATAADNGHRFNASDQEIQEHIDPCLGLLGYQARNLASGINLDHAFWPAFVEIAINLWHCYVRHDALLAEISPLAITKDNFLLALGARMVIDDNALYRHLSLITQHNVHPESQQEAIVRSLGASYVKLDGQIGCMVNGAGSAMATMDVIKLYGGDVIGPANFLDIGGGAQADKVASALHIILTDPNVECVLLNIFGGITRCDEVAKGILQALNQAQTELPIVIRLGGTNSDEGQGIIASARRPNIFSATTLTEAAKKAVDAVKRST